MKIRSRIFLSNLFMFTIGFFLLVSWIGKDLEPEYRKATEEPLVDSARVLASVVAASSEGGAIDVSVIERAFEDVYEQRFSAGIFGFLKHGVDYRVYVTDSKGKVLFHSYKKDLVGSDFSNWRDVALTLEGKYGARTSQEDPDDPSSSVMYVAAPIISEGKTIGVLAVGKPTRTANIFVSRSRRMLWEGALVIAAAVVLAGLFLSDMLTRPVQRLTAYARAVRDGKRVAIPSLDKSEIGELGEAFEEMRDTLEGKQYVERYVQTLTHEVKSPVAAIRGAVELLKEDMPQEQKARFLANIDSEAGRVHAVVEKLLLLSALESRKAVESLEELVLLEVVEDVLESLRPVIGQKGLTVSFGLKERAQFEGDRFLVRQAVMNLMANAVEFSPRGGTLSLDVREDEAGFVEFRVRDRGPGVPDYALTRVHERFYSLKRPDTGRKSSGLGLALVREVAELHGGGSVIENAPGGGAVARLTLPLRPPQTAA